MNEHFMVDAKLLEKHFIASLLYLDQQNIKADFIHINEIFRHLDIPKEYHRVIYYKLWNPRYIDGKPALNNPEIKINKKGSYFLEEFKTEHYNKTGNILDAAAVKTTLDETFEIIFQEHKKCLGSLVWTKETFLPFYPENWMQAKELLLKQGFIFNSSSANRTTLLAPEITEAASYKEAKRILKPTAMNDSEIKDKILSELITKDYQTSIDVAEKIDVSISTMHTLCRQMRQAGHIQAIEMDAPENMHLSLTDEGRHFYETTSYVKEEEKEKEKARQRGHTSIGTQYNGPVTHGPNSPIAGGDLNAGDFKNNESNPVADELSKRQLKDYEETQGISKKTLAWTIVAVIVAVIIGLLALS